jgi:hypothetical protein
MSVGTGKQNIIILFWKSQFHFWENINGNQSFILDSHPPFICSVYNDLQYSLKQTVFFVFSPNFFASASFRFFLNSTLKFGLFLRWQNATFRIKIYKMIELSVKSRYSWVEELTHRICVLAYKEQDSCCFCWDP